MEPGTGIRGPGYGIPGEVAELPHRVVDFFDRVVEMRRHADAGTRPVVNDHAPSNQFVSHARPIRHVDDDAPAAFVVRLGGGELRRGAEDLPLAVGA